MNLGLDGRVIVISGSTRGIGHAIAEAFLAEGARVTVTGRTPGTADATSTALTSKYGSDHVLGFVGDLTERAVVSQLLDEVRARWGHIDHVVTNIGSGRSTPGVVVGDAEWERVLALNFRAAVTLIEAALPELLAAKRGSIVAVGSIAGIETIGAPLAYGAAKAALTHYIAGLARLAGPSGIRANTVAPGNVLFPGGSWAERLAGDRAAVQTMLDREVALARFGTPEEIAAAVVFLASDQASFITGSCLVVDGGQTRSPK